MSKKKNFPFTMGADPEFNIVMQNKRIHAQNFLVSTIGKKNKQCSNQMGFDIGEAGSLGWDGCSSTAEIRPSPSTSPIKLAENIGEIFEAIAEHSQLFELSTLSNLAAVGGHIHLSLPEEIASNTQKVRNLDKILSSFYIPLLLGEDAVNLRVRRKSGYGDIKAHRTQGVGNGVVTFEFRTPSAEWLTTPKVCSSTLAYIGTIYNEIINHPENVRAAKEILITSNKQADALQDLSLSNFVFLTKAILTKIKKHIKTFEFYSTYKKEIDFMLSPERVLKEKQSVNFNILEGWNLYKKVEFNKRDFLGKKKIAELAKTINLEEFSQALSIQYNDDDFVSAFARDLKYRMVAFNWKPKNEYFIYGLRKGFPEMIAINKNLEFLTGKDSIKIQYDYDKIKDIFAKMNSRFYTKNSGQTEPENEEEGKKFILIGIPSDQRLAQDTKEFMKLIYELENEKKQKPEKIDLTNLPAEGESVIYNAYNEQEVNIPILENSLSQESTLQEAINEVAEESRL